MAKKTLVEVLLAGISLTAGILINLYTRDPSGWPALFRVSAGPMLLVLGVATVFLIVLREKLVERKPQFLAIGNDVWNSLQTRMRQYVLEFEYELAANFLTQTAGTRPLDLPYELFANDTIGTSGVEEQRRSATLPKVLETRTVITGAPGAGKSFLLNYIAKERVSAARTSSALRIPLLLDAKTWKSEDRTIESWIHRLLSSIGIDSSIGSLWIDSQNLLLLIDGFDDLEGTSRDEFLTRVLAFSIRFPLLPYCICCREDTLPELSRDLEFQARLFIHPLNWSEARQWLLQQGEIGRSLLGALDADSTARSLFTTPLMLRLGLTGIRTSDDVTALHFAEDSSVVFEGMVRQILAERPISNYNLRSILVRVIVQLRESGQTHFRVSEIDKTWVDSKVARTAWATTVSVVIGAVVCFSFAASQVIALATAYGVHRVQFTRALGLATYPLGLLAGAGFMWWAESHFEDDEFLPPAGPRWFGYLGGRTRREWFFIMSIIAALGATVGLAAGIRLRPSEATYITVLSSSIRYCIFAIVIASVPVGLAKAAQRYWATLQKAKIRVRSAGCALASGGTALAAFCWAGFMYVVLTAVGVMPSELRLSETDKFAPLFVSSLVVPGVVLYCVLKDGGAFCLSSLLLRVLLWRQRLLPLDSGPVFRYLTQNAVLLRRGEDLWFRHRLIEEAILSRDSAPLDPDNLVYRWERGANLFYNVAYYQCPNVKDDSATPAWLERTLARVHHSFSRLRKTIILVAYIYLRMLLRLSGKARIENRRRDREKYWEVTSCFLSHSNSNERQEALNNLEELAGKDRALRVLLARTVASHLRQWTTEPALPDEERNRCFLILGKNPLSFRFAHNVLRQIDLHAVVLRGVQGTDLSFWYCNFKGADFSNAILYDIDFRRANLQGAVFRNSEVGKYSDFSGADLRRAVLDSARLPGAVFIWSDLRDASVIEGDLRNANFNHANLSNGMFRSANMRGAFVRGARLYGTILDGADLSNVIGLKQEQLEVAHGDLQTVVPPGYRRPVHWS